MNNDTERHGALHEPPTADEMLAYSRRQLPAQQAAQVWERLQEYPDLAEIYTAPFPEDGGDYVSPEQLDARWNEIRDRLAIAPPRNLVWFPRLLSAAAAILIFILGGLLWQSQRRVHDLESQLGTPRITSEYLLMPDVRFRGPAPQSPAVRRDTDAKLLFDARGNYSDYEVEIRDTGTKGTIWRRDGLIPSDRNEIEVVLLRGALQPGQYQLVLRANARELDTFTFNVAP